MANKKSPKKPRSKYVYFDFGKEVNMNSISYDPETGNSKFFHHGKQMFPIRSWVEHGYERQKGTKVLARSVVSPESAVADVNLALGKYHELFAVDTNTKEIRGEMVSVCGVVGGVAIVSANGVICRYRPIQCIEFRGITGSPERIGWWETIQGICAAPTYLSAKRYGLVVDAYLGDHEAINGRSQPIVPDFLLPENISLIYASADVPNETLANKMLSLADGIASTILSGLDNAPPEEAPEVVQDKPYSARRYWKMSA